MYREDQSPFFNSSVKRIKNYKWRFWLRGDASDDIDGGAMGRG